VPKTQTIESKRVLCEISALNGLSQSLLFVAQTL